MEGVFYDDVSKASSNCTRSLHSTRPGRPRRSPLRVHAPKLLLQHSADDGVHPAAVDVVTVLERLAAGDTVDEVATSYGLTRQDVLAAIEYAAQIVSNELMPT